MNDSEIVVNSDDDNPLSDDDSPYGEDIDYVDASSPDVEIVSLEVVEIVDPEVGRIDDDILLTIKDDILREKLLNVNLLIAKIDALRDNPTPSSEVVIKSTSTFPNLFLEETNTFDNSIPESETFRFNLEEISSGSPTTHSELSLPDYKAFYVDNDHFKERSSGNTTTHVDFSQYDSFIFDLSNDQFPPTDRSDLNHEEFADELAHIISPSEYDHFCFKIEPELGNLTMDVVEDIFPTREPRVHVPNVLPTHLTLDTDFILLSEPLFAYIVWIFLPFLTYPVAPPYLLSTRNEDTIFDPGISIYHSFMPDVSHRSGTFMKFNDFPDCEDSRARSIHMSFTSSASFWESRMDIQEKDKKKAKSKQNRARSGKDQVKSKSKVIHIKIIQLEGPKLPNRKLYYKRKRQGSKIANQAKIAFKLYNLRGPKLPTSQKAIFPAPKTQLYKVHVGNPSPFPKYFRWLRLFQRSSKEIKGWDLLSNPLTQQAHLVFTLSKEAQAANPRDENFGYK
ncbi:hypothetical protein Tco_0661765 [Tanacetum coccineum]